MAAGGSTAETVDLHCAAGEAPGFDFSAPEPLLEQLDRHGVHRAVLGPIGRWAAVDNEAGEAVLRSWCERWPDRFARWACVNPWWSDAAARLRRSLEEGAAGLKLIPAGQGFSLLQLPLVEPLLAVAAEARKPVYVVTGVPVAAEPLQLAELARRFPDLTFVLGRSGRTDFALDLLPALTAAPNLVAETAYNGSGLIRTIISVVGAHRVAFASDAPFNDVDLELDRVTAADLPVEQASAVLGGTARRLLTGGAPWST